MGWPIDINLRNTYVLVADSDSQRVAACLESIKPFKTRVRTARDGDQAIAILERHGPPVLLLVDLLLSRQDGFAVIEALRARDRGHTAIIAWSSIPALREFALQRLAGLNVRILRGAVRLPVLHAAVERILRREPAAEISAAASGAARAEDLYVTMTELSNNARQLCGTAGVAVYLKAPGETEFRASVSWTSDAPIPHSPSWMPDVFSSVLERGKPLLHPALTSDPLSNVLASAWQDGVRGLVAVPITTASQQVVGMICVFDVKPLGVGGVELDALSALGHSISAGEAPRSIGRDRDEGDRHTRASKVPGDNDEAVKLPVELPAGLLDRRGGALAIQRELARVRREQRQLSVILFGVNPMPSPAGLTADSSKNHLVRTASEALTRVIRGSDLAIRWGREELLVVVPGVGAGEARQVAERVRAAMQVGARDAAVAGGVAELLPDETFESVVVRASEKVQLAREQGHNRVA